MATIVPGPYSPPARTIIARDKWTPGVFNKVHELTLITTGSLGHDFYATGSNAGASGLIVTGSLMEGDGARTAAGTVYLWSSGSIPLSMLKEKEIYEFGINRVTVGSGSVFVLYPNENVTESDDIHKTRVQW